MPQQHTLDQKKLFRTSHTPNNPFLAILRLSDPIFGMVKTHVTFLQRLLVTSKKIGDKKVIANGPQWPNWLINGGVTNYTYYITGMILHQKIGG